MRLLGIALVLFWIPAAQPIGGTESEPGEFPFIASIRAPRTRKHPGGHVCGGVLVAQNVVLTTGWCSTSLIRRGGRKPALAVDINRFMLTGADETRFERFEVKEAIVHPFFGSVRGVYGFDFALLVLDGESKHQPVEIHKDEKCFQEGSPCGDGVAVGWDRIRSRSSFTERLLKVELPLVPRSVCDAQYKRVDIKEDMVCAGGPGKDMCSSGSPVLINRKLAGLASFGIGCGGDYPGVYSNVARVHQWITEILGTDGKTEDPEKSEPADEKICCQYVFGAYRPDGCTKCQRLP
ncbi:hypothetical protein BSKO_09077 [Bryopsis sp. KO-2023]|nr:hypothetical protein BSKO_09077 [Bryopsis sp. KO-2023]